GSEDGEIARLDGEAPGDRVGARPAAKNEAFEVQRTLRDVSKLEPLVRRAARGIDHQLGDHQLTGICNRLDLELGTILEPVEDAADLVGPAGADQDLARACRG